MKKKIISSLLALISLITVFSSVSCKRGGGNTKDTDPAGSTSDSGTEKIEASLDILPKKDYGGTDFIINYRDLSNMVNDMSFDGESQNALEVAKYRRAMKVEEAFGVNIVPNVISGDWAGDMSLNIILADNSEVDLIMPHSHRAWATYISEGYAMEWTANMKYNHLEAEWWDQNARECLSVGGKIYTMLGDSSWMLLGSSVGILFNKNIFDENHIAYPYDDVKNHTWTFEKFHRIASDTKKDINGDGAYDLDNDRYGYTTGLFMGPTGFLWTTGNSITSKDENDIPYIDLYKESTVDLFDRFFAMMEEPGFHIYDARDSFNTEFHKEFAQGKVVMIDTMISNIEQLRDMDGFGLVPYPLYDETVESYHSTADAGVHSPIVPYNAPDPERTSIILEALTIEGYNQVLPAFYETTLKIKYTDDDADKDMLDIIRATRTFDFAYYTGAAGAFTLPGTSIFSGKTSFTAYYDANKEAAQASLEEFLEYLPK